MDVFQYDIRAFLRNDSPDTSSKTIHVTIDLGFWDFNDYVRHWGYTTYDFIDEGIGNYY